MSFQKDLTGSSNLYANVILNTNVCASSVSTTNLSATNASFTNITTNTWTTGNVSTPNVIATNAYFSNLTVSTLNNISNIITSNLSTSNLSATYVSVATRISAPVIEGVQVLKNTNTSMYLYSSGGFLVRGWNQSDPASLGLYYASTPVEDMFGMNFEVAKIQGTTRGYSRITVGQNLSFQIIADTVPQLENTSTTGWKFYSSINSSGRANISNVYSSSMYTSTINVSTVNASNMSIFNFSAEQLYATFINDVSEITSLGAGMKIFSPNLIIRNLTNAATDVLYNYDDATFTEVNGYKFTVGYTSGVVANVSNLSYNFMNSGVSQLQNTSLGWTYFKPINISNIYSSNASIKNLDCNTLFRYTSAFGTYLQADYSSIFYLSNTVGNISALTGVSAVYTCIYCSNLSVSNISIAGSINVNNLSIGNRLEVANSIDTSNIYASTMYASNIDVLNRIDAKKVVLTINLDTPIANVSDLRVSNISGINVSVSAITTSTMSASSITVDNIVLSGINVSNISVSYISGFWQTNSSLQATDSWFANISATGITTVSYFSAKLANISNLSVSNALLNNASINEQDIGYRQYFTQGIGGTDIAEVYGDSYGMWYNIIKPNSYTHRFQHNDVDLLIIGNTSVTAYQPFYASTANFSTLNVSNTSITNLSTTLISNSSRISASSISVSNMSIATKLTVANVSITSELSGTFNTTATGTLQYTSIYASYLVANGAFGVSARNICSVSSYISYVSVSNLSGGTLQATTANFSTLNVSSFALTSVSLTNLSVSTKATITSISCSEISTSQIVFGNLSLYGYIDKLGTSMTINSQGGTNAILLSTLGTTRMDIAQTGIRSYVSFFVSRGNFSVLNVSTFNPASITTTTVTASTINASTLSVSTFNPATITTTTITASTINASSSNICNISVSNLSTYSNDVTLLRVGSLTTGGATIKSDYDTPALAFSTSNNFLMGRFGFDYYTSEFNINTYTTGGIYRTTLDTPNMYVSTSTLNVCNYNGSLVAQINTNTSRFSISNISTSYVSTADITSTDGNITYLYGSTFYPDYIVAGGGEFSGTVNFSNISIQKINNSFSTITTSQPLTLYSVSNTSTTGLRVPTYVDSQDLGALTLGYNQTTGFINVCRSARFYDNVLINSNINGINATDSLTLGNNTTTGNIRIGNSTMTGNISIQTTGDCIFECDRRSTWNTSDMVSFSTQLGSNYNYAFNTNLNNISGITDTRLFFPQVSNASLLTVPVGLYLVTATGYIGGFGGYDGVLGNCYMGICHSANASFTNGNTSRTNITFNFRPNILGSNATQGGVLHSMALSWAFNMSIPNRYLGVYIQVGQTTLATVGSLSLNVNTMSVTKIA